MCVEALTIETILISVEGLHHELQLSLPWEISVVAEVLVRI